MPNVNNIDYIDIPENKHYIIRIVSKTHIFLKHKASGGTIPVCNGKEVKALDEVVRALWRFMQRHFPELCK